MNLPHQPRHRRPRLRSLPTPTPRHNALPRHRARHESHVTHKDLIIRLHLQGHTTLEIARQTHHNPKGVDASLKTVDAVLILRHYRIPPQLAATILGHGASLVDEYHHIMRLYRKDP